MAGGSQTATTTHAGTLRRVLLTARMLPETLYAVSPTGRWECAICGEKDDGRNGAPPHRPDCKWAAFKRSLADLADEANRIGLDR